MKLITQLENDVLFLKTSYKIAKMVMDYTKDTKILEIRKRQPLLKGDETEEEKAVLFRSQASENLLAMVEVALDKYPERTLAIANCLYVLDEGEEQPHGLQLIELLMKLATDDSVLDFFTSLMGLEQKITSVTS